MQHGVSYGSYEARLHSNDLLLLESKSINNRTILLILNFGEVTSLNFRDLFYSVYKVVIIQMNYNSSYSNGSGLDNIETFTIGYLDIAIFEITFTAELSTISPNPLNHTYAASTSFIYDNTTFKSSGQNTVLSIITICLLSVKFFISIFRE